jgi:hypothetical protein
MLLTTTGWAISDMEPASVLVFPYYDSTTTDGKDTLISVTNVNKLQIYDPATDTLLGDVYTKWYYVDGEDCDISDRELFLTPADMVTVLASEHNPSANTGWLYVVAMDPFTKLLPIKFDWQWILGNVIFNSGLIGDALAIDAKETYVWGIPAIGIKAAAFLNFKDNADLDFDGILDFGIEYEGLPSALFISSFIEVGKWNSSAELVLLSFVPDEDVKLDFLFYNNDEEEFSQEWDFECWAHVPITEIFPSADNLTGPTGKSSHYDDTAPVQTAWASIEVEEAGNLNRFNVPILGLLIQKINGNMYQAAHLLHHSQDQLVFGGLEYNGP